MKLPKLLPLKPYLPAPYLQRLEAIQTTIDKVQRAPVVRKRNLPSIFERQPFLAERVRRKVLGGQGGSIQTVAGQQEAYEDEHGAGQAVAATAARGASLTRAVPFFKDEAHRQPTRALYRALLRQCRGCSAGARDPRSEGAVLHTVDEQKRSDSARLEGIIARLRRDWCRHQHLTSIPLARTFLSSQYDLLDMLRTPNSAVEVAALDAELRKSTRLFPDVRNLPTDSHTHKHFKQPKSGSVRPRAAPRPRLTGGFMRAGIDNPPMPRLRPQPIGVSMMIHKRIQARMRWQGLRRDVAETKEDMRAEAVFWRSFVPGPVAVGGSKPSPSLMPSPPPSLSRTPSSSPEAGASGAKHGETPSQGLTEETVQELAVGWNKQAVDSLKVIDGMLQAGWDRKAGKFDEGLVRRVMRAKQRRQAYLRQRAAARAATGTEPS